MNKVLVERYAYDVFGRPTIRDPNGLPRSESAWGNPYLFTGRAYDAESGLYYYRARYYDYATGKFLQPDPTGYADGLNLYSYVGNNPIDAVDPLGLCKKSVRGILQSDDFSLGAFLGALLGIRARTPLSGTGRTYSEEETAQILHGIANPFVYVLAHGGPIGHMVPYPWGGYDFRPVDDSFTVRVDGKLEVLSSSSFGNFAAGYAGTFYGGDFGLGVVFYAGDFYAGQEGAAEDDPQSRHDIVLGSHYAEDEREARERLYDRFVLYP